MMTFSFRPRRKSSLPVILASVRTRVVSWNEAADIKLSALGPVKFEQYRAALAGRRHRQNAVVLFTEEELIHNLVVQKFCIAHIFDADPPHHLTYDNFDVLVIDVTLRCDLLVS
jgi:hypothetical protein